MVPAEMIMGASKVLILRSLFAFIHNLWYSGDTVYGSEVGVLGHGFDSFDGHMLYTDVNVFSDV